MNPAGTSKCGNGLLIFSSFILQRSAMPRVRESTSGAIFEDAVHFVVALDEKSGALELHAIGVLDGLAGLYAQHHILGVGVVFAEVMAVIGGDQREPQFFFQAKQVRSECGAPARRPWSWISRKKLFLPKMSL